MSYPDITTAISLWQESISGNCSWNKEKSREYIYHTNGVGDAAFKIAEHCGMNSEKAYALGLLHDYGKIQNEKESGIAHFIYGYNEMLKKGWDEVAKICITHSFPNQHIDFARYPKYNQKDLQSAQDIISTVQYDDYDRLVQLCDMFFEGTKKMSITQRIAGIQLRYNLRKTQTDELEKYALANKKYFDEKCGCDIYKILDM